MKQNCDAGIRSATVHALFWLAAGNAIGVMIAILLLFPGLNRILGEWTYGRWMMVHMNLGLFGWCSLPMLGGLFHVYKVGSSSVAQWSRPAVWIWSSALLLGSWTWLQGDSSGKLFLDWSGLPRFLFPLAMLFLWFILAVSFLNAQKSDSRQGRVAKVLGLVLLLPVPVLIYLASSPDLYPAYNPDTGGPTGTSQLESSLGIVLIFLLLPLGLVPRKQERFSRILYNWVLLGVESTYCALMNHTDVSHRVPAQFLGLCLMLFWIPLVPAYYESFLWSSTTTLWRKAFYWWWRGLTLTGCFFFLPGVLDYFKFTDGLVGHSLTAIAGCLTAYLIFLLIQLLGEDGWFLLQRRSFLAWNHSVLLYVVLMTVAGWLEGIHPAFTIAPGFLRNLLYALRLISGLGMLLASLEWLFAALRQQKRFETIHTSHDACLATNRLSEEPA
jgi:cytochrome c oxidase cbb3-type subunit 1